MLVHFKIALSLAIIMCCACATVPVTGRQSLNIVPEPDLLKLSYDQYRDVLKKSSLSQNPQQVQMVRNVGQRIARATEDFFRQQGMGQEVASFRWEFNVIDDDKTVNAWCMPGGKVAVYTGILPICRDETGLAVVLGHEVAHAVAKHGNERLSQALLAQLGAAGLSAALSTQPGATRDIFMRVYGAGAQVGVLLPYGRLQETEADRIGLILMAKAGYDPRQAVPFWQRMASRGGGKRGPEFLSTHPVPESRIRDIQADMPEALRYYRGM